MTTEQQTNKRRGIIQILALLLLLVAFPAVSWYYLQTGLDYRLETMGDLGEFGNVPDFELVSYKLDTLQREDLKEKMLLATFFSLEDPLMEIYGKNLGKLHEQFDERNDLLFLQHIVGDDQSAEQLHDFELKYNLTDETQVYFMVKGSTDLEQLARKGYRIPLEEGMSVEQSPYLILADTTGTIRQYYDVRKPEEVKRLVEHIAILLPRVKERDIVFKREPEK